jgi:hypothetical protein
MQVHYWIDERAQLQGGGGRLACDTAATALERTPLASRVTCPACQRWLRGRASPAAAYGLGGGAWAAGSRGSGR